MKRQSSRARISAAFRAMLRLGEKHSFVVIEEPRTGKWVQFGKGQRLGMDVPLIALTDDEAKRAYRFFRRLREHPREYHAPEQDASRRNLLSRFPQGRESGGKGGHGLFR